MQYQETMTLDDKLAISCKSAELRKAGSEYLISSGWNLSETELAFEPNWLGK